MRIVRDLVLVLLAGAAVGAARGQGVPDSSLPPAPVARPDPVAEPDTVDPMAAWHKALVDVVARAREAIAGRKPDPGAQRIVDALVAITPALREQHRALVGDWIPEIYARFGQTDWALGRIADGRESAVVVRVLLVSLDYQFATKNAAGIKDVATRFEELFMHSKGTPSAPGLFDTTMKIRARMGDASGAAAVATLGFSAGLDERQVSAIRVGAIRVMIAENRIDAAAKMAGMLSGPVSRFDAYAALGQAREKAGDIKGAGGDYVTALAALLSYMHAPMEKDEISRALPPTAVPVSVVAVGVFRCSADTALAERFVADLDVAQQAESKRTMLDAAGDAGTRVRIAAAFRDVLMVGEETVELGRAADAGKIVQAYMAGQTPLKKAADILGAAAEDEAPSASGMPGRIDNLIRAGRVLGETGLKADARAAFGRALEGLDLIQTRYNRPDWVAEVAVAQAGAGLQEESAAAFAKAVQAAKAMDDVHGFTADVRSVVLRCHSILVGLTRRREAKYDFDYAAVDQIQNEMLARVALAQIQVGDLAGAMKTAELLPEKTPAGSGVDVYPAIAAGMARQGRHADADALYQRAMALATPGLRPEVAASVIRFKVATGDVVGAAALLKGTSNVPISVETYATIIAAEVKTGKIAEATMTVNIGADQVPTAPAARVKLAATRLKNARQYRAAIETLAIAPQDITPETMAGIYIAAAEAGEAEYLVAHTTGDELSMGERAAAVALARKKDMASAKAILAKLVDAHTKVGDLGVKYPALVADGMALAAIGEKEAAKAIGRDAFKRSASLWVTKGWTDKWLPDVLSGATILRVAAEDYEQLAEDVGKMDPSVRPDLAGVMATALLNQTGPMAGAR